MKGAKRAVELLAATKDQAGRRDHAIGPLPARKPRTLLDAVERHLAGAAEDRKDRAVLQEINGVVAPFAGRDLAAIEPEEAAELGPVESDLVSGELAWGGGD